MNERWFFGNKDDLKDAIFIRTEVFIKEQLIDEAEEFDGTDEKYNSSVLVLYDEDKPFATGRLMQIEEKLFIGRVAILKQYRKLNYGKIILEKLINRAKWEFSKDEIYIHSQVYAKGFYEKFGFICFGEEFLDAGIPHINMKIKI